MAEKIVRIGGAGAGWGDGEMAVPQLVNGGNVDYIIMDFLSEYFLPVMGRIRKVNPEGGYAADFAGRLIRPTIREFAAKGVKLVSNAGAANPAGLAKAFRKMLREEGVDLKVAWVGGDDLIDRAAAFQSADTREMFSGEPWPDRPINALHAYMGAEAIARALDAGADVVITGRVVDSALVLGPLIHEFGWAMDDYDRLAAGSTLGHLLECGAQASGGLFTDWEEVPDWAHIGYPIAECRADGSAVITKAPGTGGLVSVGTVAEQLLYEIGDPQRYLLPDVVADLSGVTVIQVGENRVEVKGARGYAPTAFAKAVAGYDDGWRGFLTMPMRGPKAKEKGIRMAQALEERVSGLFRARNMAPFSAKLIESFGDETSYGAQARNVVTREMVCRLTVEHQDKAGIDMLMNEASTMAVSMLPGNMGAPFGRGVSEVGRVFAFLVPKADLTAFYVLGDAEPEPVPYSVPAQPFDHHVTDVGDPMLSGGETQVPLLSLAWVRNGDKGNASNIGVIARKPEYLPFLAAALTADTVRNWYKHILEEGDQGLVERFYLPGTHALNFLLHDALGGGCTSSLRFDALGKSVAQEILDFPVSVSAEVAARLPK